MEGRILSAINELPLASFFYILSLHIADAVLRWKFRKNVSHRQKRFSKNRGSKRTGTLEEVRLRHLVKECLVGKKICMYTYKERRWFSKGDEPPRREMVDW